MELSSLFLTSVLNYQALYNYGVLMSVTGVVVLTSEAGRTDFRDELAVPRDGKSLFTVTCVLVADPGV